MRLKAGIWVSAYLRRLGAMAVPALVVRRGDGDAGAIYIKINHLDGTVQVLRPASAGGELAAEERHWSAAFKAPRTEQEADLWLARQREFDADLWVIEVEDKAGRHFLDEALIEE